MVAIAAGLPLAALLVIWLNTSFSWDRQRHHSQQTARLPALQPDQLAATGLQRIAVGALEFRARLAGPPANAGNLLLLHGFAESSATWINLMERAAAAGYRSVAFDQRGYSPGARPLGAQHYTLANLAADAAAVANAVGFDRYHLVGNDAGGRVAWALLRHAPERVRTLTTINAPLPAPAEGLGDGPRRWLSWPWLPEQVLAFNRFDALRSSLWHPPPPGVSEYMGMLREPGALRAALEWYRAPSPSASELTQVPPVLLIWGQEAATVGRAGLARQREQLGAQAFELELSGGAALLGQHEALVASAVLDHLRRGSSGALPKRLPPTTTGPSPTTTHTAAATAARRESTSSSGARETNAL